MKEEFEQLLRLLKHYQGSRFGDVVRVQVALSVLVLLEDIFINFDEDPQPKLLEEFTGQLAFLRTFKKVQEEATEQISREISADGTVSQTKTLFEQAWTIYNPETYKKSVDLIIARLNANDYNSEFFDGLRCFDGGCGTGRFSIAMALLGAKEVVAADMGGASLEFAKERARELGVEEKINFVERDITDLSCFEDNSFDFVVSYGVLHHTVETEKGLREHLRITKPEGLFWLYLYGKGGLYWEIYDSLKTSLEDIPITELRAILAQLGVRQGLAYTFMDNVRAPIRKYYSLSETISTLEAQAQFQHWNAKGISTVDDTHKVIESKWGKYMLGEDGEIRIIVKKD